MFHSLAGTNFESKHSLLPFQEKNYWQDLSSKFASRPGPQHFSSSDFLDFWLFQSFVCQLQKGFQWQSRQYIIISVHHYPQLFEREILNGSSSMGKKAFNTFLLKTLTISDKFYNIWQLWQFLTTSKIYDKFDNFWQLWQLLTTLTILETCDFWDTDYNSDNWEPEFLTIFVTWQSRVTLDSSRNSCDV